MPAGMSLGASEKCKESTTRQKEREDNAADEEPFSNVKGNGYATIDLCAILENPVGP